MELIVLVAALLSVIICIAIISYYKITTARLFGCMGVKNTSWNRVQFQLKNNKLIVEIVALTVHCILLASQMENNLEYTENAPDKKEDSRKNKQSEGPMSKPIQTVQAVMSYILSFFEIQFSDISLTVQSPEGEVLEVRKEEKINRKKDV